MSWPCGTVVPIDLSRSYVRAAVDAGDRAELVELFGGAHVEYLDATNKAHGYLP